MYNIISIKEVEAASREEWQEARDRAKTGFPGDNGWNGQGTGSGSRPGPDNSTDVWNRRQDTINQFLPPARGGTLTPGEAYPTFFLAYPMNTIRLGDFSFNSGKNNFSGNIYWDKGDFPEDADREHIINTISNYIKKQFPGIRDFVESDFGKIDLDDRVIEFEMEEAFPIPISAKSELEEIEENIPADIIPEEPKKEEKKDTEVVINKQRPEPYKVTYSIPLSPIENKQIKEGLHLREIWTGKVIVTILEKNVSPFYINWVADTLDYWKDKYPITFFELNEPVKNVVLDENPAERLDPLYRTLADKVHGAGMSPIAAADKEREITSEINDAIKTKKAKGKTNKEESQITIINKEIKGYEDSIALIKKQLSEKEKELREYQKVLNMSISKYENSRKEIEKNPSDSNVTKATKLGEIVQEIKENYVKPRELVVNELKEKIAPYIKKIEELKHKILELREQSGTKLTETTSLLKRFVISTIIDKTFNLNRIFKYAGEVLVDDTEIRDFKKWFSFLLSGCKRNN